MQAAAEMRAALQAYVDAKLKPRGGNSTEWAVRAGVSESALRNFLATTSQTMNYSTLRKLAQVEGITVSAMMGETNEGESISGPVYILADKAEVLVRPAGKIALQFWSAKGVEAEVLLPRLDAEVLGRSLREI